MKLTLMVIGKTDPDYLQEGIEEYSKRLGHYINFEFRVIPFNRNKRISDDLSAKEITKIISALGSGRELCLLDEKGKQFSSREFAIFLEKKMASSLKELIFIAGGPYGFPEEIYKSAGSIISLSKMTFSHQMVRLLFLEQLYRAFTILKGEPYHHD